jgi:TonB family protein
MIAQFLGEEAQTIAIAIFAAIGLDLVRRLLGALAGLVRRPAGREGVFFPGGPPPSEDELRGRTIFGFLSFCLVPVIGVIAFVPALVTINSLTVLFDLGEPKVAELAHGHLLLWTLLIAFIWIQLRHMMALRSFWSRCRYLLLLVSLPLIAQILAWLCFDLMARNGIATANGLFIANKLTQFLCLGAFPYFIPSFHARTLGPAFNWAGGLFGEPRRKGMELVGNVLLVPAAFALFVLFGFVYGTTQFVAESKLESYSRPVAIGKPHACFNYPAVSLRLGEQGTTALSFIITREGTVRNISVSESSGYEGLDLAAVTCASSWTYLPAMAGGRKAETPWKAQVVWLLK